MRIETLELRSWLLVAIAGWGLIVWLLTIAGMGGRIIDNADQESVVSPALANLPAANPERLREHEHYMAIAEQPLFSEDRRPKVFQLVADVAPAPVEEVRLTGVLITSQLQLATVQTGRGGLLRLRLDGPEVAGWRLLSLQPRAAVVSGPDGKRLVELQTYHGEDAPRGTASTVGAPTPSHVGATRISDTASHVAAATPVAPAKVPDSAPNDVERIRQRIEARRSQLMQQQGSVQEDVPDAPNSR